MRNLSLAVTVLQQLAARGVSEVCLCPGARNAPLVVLLEAQSDILVHPFFEERSAAFFALGRAKRLGRPVAICTTSGTACAELLPAFIESYYSGLSLVALTADRPRRLRGTGAPQSIEQVGLFGRYGGDTIDIAPGEAFSIPETLGRSNLHINLCFDEPLIDGEVVGERFPVSKAPVQQKHSQKRRSAELEQFLAQVQKPLVIVGPLGREERAAVVTFITALGAPVFCEAPSGIKGLCELSSVEIRSSRSLNKENIQSTGVDGVLRFGGVPTHRLWRDLDEDLSSIAVCSVTHTGYGGLNRGTIVVGHAHEELPGLLGIAERSTHTADFLKLDQRFHHEFESSLVAAPESEAAMIRTLSRHIPCESLLYLGNSLPIREWEDAAAPGNRPSVEANRGANGIDGQLSTFMGWSRGAEEAWAIVGDLTALYDLAAPWSATPEGRCRVVILNNHGGRIFTKMFRSSLFVNRHDLSFEGWAEMWGFDYQRWRGGESFPERLPDRVVIEALPHW